MSAPIGWREEILARRSEFEGELLVDEPLSRHTYYRIGGPAALLAAPKTEKDLSFLRSVIRGKSIPFFILGAGSNLLASDSGFDGIVIKLSKLEAPLRLHPSETSVLETGAATTVTSLLRKAAQSGWGGLEFMTGIPGTVGGVVAMNAGTHLGEAKDRLIRVETFSLTGEKERHEFSGQDLRFEYRKNLFIPPDHIITKAFWGIRPEDPAAVKTRIDEVLLRRKSSQPLEYPSCGSVFKNPLPNVRAWETIERLRLRGHQIGMAQFSEKHPNFIVNRGGAKASDVRALIDLAKARAKTELGIELHEEVKYVGDFAS